MNIKSFCLFVATVFFLLHFSTLEVSSQNQQVDINSVDFSKIKVDDLSDDQISQLIKKAEDNGLTQQQIETVALSKGMPQEEVQKLRLRMNTIQTLGNTKNQGTDLNAKGRKEAQTIKRKDLKPDELLEELFAKQNDSLLKANDPRKQIFGFSLFNTQDLTFEPSVNFPTPARLCAWTRR